MPINPNRYPHTPEGMAQKEHDMTKNCQPVGSSERPHSKIFTREKFLEDRNNQIKQQNNNSHPKKQKKVRGDALSTKNNLKNLSDALIEYSLREDSLDMHGFLRDIDLSPQTLLKMSKNDPDVGHAYDRAKSNFAYNNLMFLRKKLNQTALAKSAALHSRYSEFLKDEVRREKRIDKKMAVEVFDELQQLRKSESTTAPEPQVVVKLEY